MDGSTSLTTFMVAPQAKDEASRLAALDRFAILDTPPEACFDAIATIAAQVCGTPAALISFVDAERQWFKARVQMKLTQTPRAVSFCGHAITQPDRAFVVENAHVDERFSQNPLVIGEPHICYYAGSPIRTRDGAALGTVCVLDTQPHHPSPDQLQLLGTLSDMTLGLLEQRQRRVDLERKNERLRKQHQSLTERHQRLERDREALARDCSMESLTGLGNWRFFDRVVSDEILRAKRFSEYLSLLMIDVDHFKTFNDAFGHWAGDHALRDVGTVLSKCTRAFEHAARYGGDEFAVVLPRTDLAMASVMAERIRLAIQRYAWRLQPITVSIGVACVLPGESAVKLTESANAAMHEAKQFGRNRVAPGR